MSHDWTDNRKNLMLFSGRAHPELAEQVAKELDVPVTAQTARDFANGEIFVRFDESVRGCDAFVLQSHPWPLNQWLMEQLLMIDALKRGSAKRITAILPFYPYARQDKKHRGREPISARLVADLLKTAGADRIVTVDLHTDQIQGFFDGPVDHMRAQKLLTGYIAENYADHDMVVVSPDSGRVRVAEKWADSLGGVPLAFIHKTRDPLVRRALLHMQQNLDAAPGVGEIAARLGVSRRKLERHMREALGLSPAAAFLKVRLAHARFLLARPGHSVTRIAAEAGFCDVSHLIRVFRQHEGTTPEAWRQANAAQRAPV